MKNPQNNPVGEQEENNKKGAFCVTCENTIKSSCECKIL